MIMQLISSYQRQPSSLLPPPPPLPPLPQYSSLFFYSSRTVTVVVVIIAVVVLSGDFTHFATTTPVDQRLHHYQQHNLQDYQDSDLGFESICETESFNATCETGSAVLMTHAHYGRMRLSRCAKIDYGHIGCSSDVIELADTRCSGRSSCEITIPDALFARTKPCPEDLKPYLDAGYSCVPVQSPSYGEDCSSSSSSSSSSAGGGSFYPIYVRDSGGFIANLVTESTGCGGLGFPWTIEARPGQRVHLTLFDFGVAGGGGGGGGGGHRPPVNYVKPRCPLYAVVRERLNAAEVKKFDVCGGMAREKSVYTSQTNRVEVGIAKIEDPVSGPYFMFKYEVVGCVDMHPLPWAWVRRHGDRLVVKCNFTKDEYHLRCVGRQWVGDRQNCSSAVASTVSEKYERVDLVIMYGSSVMIMIVTALGMGLFVLSAGLIILARRKTIFSQSKNRQSQQTTARRNFLLRYDGDNYVTAATTCHHRLQKTGSVHRVRSVRRSSYVDLTLQTTTSGGNSPTGSSGVEEEEEEEEPPSSSSANTPLFASTSVSARCESSQPPPPFFCCECRTSGFDRKSSSSGQSTSGSRLVRTQRGMAWKNTGGFGRRRDSTTMAMVPKVEVAAPLQTDDIKLQTSLCAAHLSSSGNQDDDDDDVSFTSRDVEVEKFSSYSSSGGRNEPAPPRAHIF